MEEEKTTLATKFNSRAIVTILILGLCLRLLALFVTHFYLDSATLFIDDITYDRLGNLVADNLKQGRLVSLQKITCSVANGYYYYVGFIYYLFGHNILYVKIFNILASLAVILLIYNIVKKFYSRRIAIYSACLASFWPSLIFCSILNIKDILIIYVGVIILNDYRINYVICFNHLVWNLF